MFAVGYCNLQVALVPSPIGVRVTPVVGVGDTVAVGIPSWEEGPVVEGTEVTVSVVPVVIVLKNKKK